MIYLVLHEIFFWYLLSHSWDICTLVPNDSKFLVYLKSFFAYFISEIGLILGYLQFWIWYVSDLEIVHAKKHWFCRRLTKTNCSNNSKVSRIVSPNWILPKYNNLRRVISMRSLVEGVTHINTYMYKVRTMTSSSNKVNRNSKPN